MTISLLSQQVRPAQSVDVYVGTYTGPNAGHGIYRTTLNLQTGELHNTGLAYAITNPTFLEIHPNLKFLYAVTEQDQGAVIAFAIEPATKRLRLLNQSSSKGKGPCHLCISRDGRTVLVANYDSGSVASIPINEDGTLAEAASFVQHSGSSLNPQRQQHPHAHSVTLSPDNCFAFVADLGIDKILIYTFDPHSRRLLKTGRSEVNITPGAGPRHFTFSPNGKFAYLINELDETIVSFAYDSNSGTLNKIQTLSTLPENYTGKSFCAEVRVHPNGKFLYGSNRGHDSIVSYKIDAEHGVLALQGFQNCGIRNPRNFNIDPTGQHCLVANQDANSVIVFRIDQETGLLYPTGRKIRVDKPVCVRFVS